MHDNKIFVEQCRVLHKVHPTEDSCQLLIESPRLAAILKPGQFVNVLPPVGGKSSIVHRRGFSLWEEWVPGQEQRNPKVYALLRRPLSVHQINRVCQDSACSFAVLFRVLGKGTRLISEMNPGAMIDVMGPLGNPYPMPSNSTDPIYLVAGGFGVAPLVPLAEAISTNGNPVTFFWGVENAADIPMAITEQEPALASFSGWAVDRLRRSGIDSFLAVRQGMEGAFRGTAVELFQTHLEQQSIGPGRSPIVYTCGPEPMMRRISEFAQSRQWSCRVSLEKYMACGIGACMSCVCKLKSNGQADSVYYQRTCTEGPSFWGESVLWER